MTQNFPLRKVISTPIRYRASISGYGGRADATDPSDPRKTPEIGRIIAARCRRMGNFTGNFFYETQKTYAIRAVLLSIQILPLDHLPVFYCLEMSDKVQFIAENGGIFVS